MTSAPGSSGPCSTRTWSGWRMRPSTSSTVRTSDDCETSKRIWAFGRRTTDSEVIDGDAVEVAAGIPRHRSPGNSVRAVDLDRDGRTPGNPPLRWRDPRARADGDAPRPAASVHVPDRVAWRSDGFGVVFRPLSATDSGARSGGDPFHNRVGGRRAVVSRAFGLVLRQRLWIRH